MNLNTPYLGLTLRNPLVVGASPLCDNTHLARQLEDAGAAAIVMHSLFEEQIDAEQRALLFNVEAAEESTAESTSFFPTFEEYQLTPDHYLRKLAELKQQLTIPVIASLNGCRPGGWTDYAQRFESAGADAMELNLYQLVTNPEWAAEDVEADMLATVNEVTSSVKIPVTVKLSPFHTSPAQFITALEGAGAKGVVLFNRFYQPDFDLDELEVSPQLKLSDPGELLLRLRWLAIVSPHFRGSLAASGGVHGAMDVVKAILAGAHAVQLVSVLLRNGPRVLTSMLGGLTSWMEERGYKDLSELRGAMNLRRCPDPAGFERANYIKILQSWKV